MKTLDEAAGPSCVAIDEIRVSPTSAPSQAGYGARPLTWAQAVSSLLAQGVAVP